MKEEGKLLETFNHKPPPGSGEGRSFPVDDSAAFPRPTQDELSWDLAGLFRGAIRLVLECVLQEEVKELVGARRYERLASRKDQLNGTYLRRLLTSLGLIEVAVPRTRANGSPTDVIGRYKRRTGEIDRMVTSAYVEGVSTRDMIAFPMEHWIRIRSTNGLERLNGEIKRRIRSVGAFPDRDSALRLITAVALETTRVWSDRRYLDMSWPKTVTKSERAVA
jgi:transposase-like protein